MRNDVLRKQLTFCDATAGFPMKRSLKNERKNSILMTCHYPYLGSACDWLRQISLAMWPIRNTTQIWVMTRHQCGISALVPQTSFRRRRNQWWRLEMCAVYADERHERPFLTLVDLAWKGKDLVIICLKVFFASFFFLLTKNMLVKYWFTVIISLLEERLL